MTNSRHRLSPKVSFRAFEKFAVLLDHGTNDVLRLNAAAGRVLRAIDAGRELEANAFAFAEELARRGHVLRPGEQAATSADGPVRHPEPQGSGRVLDRINREAAGQRIPLHCQLEVTYRCLLGCRHCYLPPDAVDTESELSLREITALLDQLADLGCLFLLLTGGEPFVRPDIEEIFNAARERRFAVSFLTSGAGVHLPKLGRMAEQGIDSIQVSLYGADAATHDGMTGAPGSFDTALACLRRCRDLGLRVRAGVTLMRPNIGSLAAIESLLRDEGVPLALGLYIEPRRDGVRDPQDLAVDEDALLAALETFPPGDEPRLAERGLDDAPCDAGANVLAVDPYGGVYPCLSLRRSAGSIRETDLRQIWTGSAELERVRSLRIADLDDCPTCEHRTSCNRCTGFAASEGLGLGGHALLDCAQARVLACIKERSSTPRA